MTREDFKVLKKGDILQFRNWDWRKIIFLRIKKEMQDAQHLGEWSIVFSGFNLLTGKFEDNNLWIESAGDYWQKLN